MTLKEFKIWLEGYKEGRGIEGLDLFDYDTILKKLLDEVEDGIHLSKQTFPNTYRTPEVLPTRIPNWPNDYITCSQTGDAVPELTLRAIM